MLLSALNFASLEGLLERVRMCDVFAVGPLVVLFKGFIVTNCLLRNCQF